MTDLTISEFGDTWINSVKTDANYGSTDSVHVKSGERRGLLRPSLPNIAGRTVTSATLTGHAAAALVSQTFTLSAATERWTPGAATWAYPSTGGPTVNAVGAVSVSPGAVASGGVVTFDVTAHIQAVADGTDWFGWRLATDSTSTGQRFRSTESGEPAWELLVTLSDIPDAPTSLKPDGGDIPEIAPMLSWEFGDAGLGNTAQAQFRVQVDTPVSGLDPDEVTPDFDTGWVVSPSPFYDLYTSTFNLFNQVTSTGDFETAATGMAGISATVARVTTQAYRGTASLSATATSATTIQAVTSGTGTSAVDVAPSTGYAIQAFTKAAVTSRNANWQYTAYNSGGTSVTAPTAGAAVADSPSTWVNNLATFTTGSTVQFMRLQHAWASAANAEVHYLDRAALVKGGGTDTPTFWRVAVKDADGNESEFSDWASYEFVAMPSLIVDSPTGGVIGDPTPTVVAHLTSGTVGKWEAMVTSAFRADIRWRSGVQLGPTISFQIPFSDDDSRRVLIDDKQSWLYLRVYPYGDWVVGAKAPAYQEAWVPITWNDTGGITAPTALTVAQVVAGEPKCKWQWSRSVIETDGYIAQVDGVTVARIDAADITTVGGGVYSWTDNGEITPLRPHATLKIRAVESGGRSTAASVANFTHKVKGVWVLPDDTTIAPFMVDGAQLGNAVRTDYRDEQTTSTGRIVDIIYGNPGRVLPFEGSIDARNGATALWTKVAAIEALRDSKIRTGRLVWGSQSAKGRFRDVDVTSDDNLLPNMLQHKVRFSFVESLD